MTLTIFEQALSFEYVYRNKHSKKLKYYLTVLDRVPKEDAANFESAAFL